MHPAMGLHRYTETAPQPFGAWRGVAPPGHCRHCGQPSASCCCGCRECRKEAKELLVTPSTTDRQSPTGKAGVANQASLIKALAVGTTPNDTIDTSNAAKGTSFIGGGCCVTLAVEYAPSVSTAKFIVLVSATDAEGTVLLWARSEAAGTGYRVHECIITTKPGATLTVEALNCTARVRWCEVFSC